MPIDAAQTRKGDQNHLLLFSRLKSHTRAGGNIETHTSRLFAIEGKRWIDFEEVIVASHLNRPVAGVSHEKGGADAALIGDDGIRRKQVFAWNHKNIPPP